MVQNGGFEDGEPGDDSEAQKWDQIQTVATAGRSHDEAHTDGWSMRLGIPRGGTPEKSHSSARQRLEIPSGSVVSATLQFWYFTESDRTPSDVKDGHYFFIFDRCGNDHLIGVLDNSQRDLRAWETASYDLSGYDWPITVHFEVANHDSAGSSRMYIDDVSVHICVDEGSQSPGRSAYGGLVEAAY